MKIQYEILDSDPFVGIIETWDLKGKVLSGYVSPHTYGFYWKTIEEEINPKDIVKLLNRCVYIKKVW